MPNYVVQVNSEYVTITATRPMEPWAQDVLGEVDDSLVGKKLIQSGDDFVEDTAAQAAEDQANADAEAVSALYKIMVDEVAAEMYNVFKTTRSDSAIATRETWQDMSANASDYIASNLKVPYTVLNPDDSTLFGPGDLLNTVEKVEDYANRMLEIARQYGIWRMNRIDQFRTDRDAILNP